MGITRRWVTITGTALLSAVSWPAAALPFECVDDFAGYPPGTAAVAGWEVVSGAWEIRDGGFWTGGTDGDVAYPRACSRSGEQTMAATVRIIGRSKAQGWATAGIALRQDGRNFWALRLVEGPGGQRYAELAESYRGRWQAQSGGPTALDLVADNEQEFRWEDDHQYVLEATVSEEAVRGRVTDAATGAVVFRKAWAFGDAPAVRDGRLALMADGLEMLVTEVVAKGEAPEMTRRPPPERRRVWVLDELLPGTDRELAGLIAEGLEEDGFAVARVSAEEAARPEALAVGKVDLLVVPAARRLPAVLREPLHRYLSAGGRVFALGAPLGEEFLFRVDGDWVTRADALSRVQPGKVLSDFERAGLDDWTHAIGLAGEAATWRRAVGPGGVQDAIEIDVPRLDTWDTFLSAPLHRPFPEGANLTTIWAKGSDRTTGMVVEWRERDGSRWIARVELTQEWRRHVLHPDDFEYWPDADVTGRGGADDRFDPQAARQLSVGLAMSHSSLDRGPQHYWIGEIGVAADPAAEYDVSPLLLESLSPGYKVYPVGKMKRGRARGDQAILSDATAVSLRGKPNADGRAANDRDIVAERFALPGPFAGVSALSRPRGLGVAKERLGRWIPLVECYDYRDVRRGTVAWLYLSFAEPYRRAAWGAIGINDQEYLRRNFDSVRPILSSAASALCEGLFLRKAGADEFAYFPDESMTQAAQVASLNAEEGDEELQVRQWVGPRAPLRAGVRTSRAVQLPRGEDAMVAVATHERAGRAPGDYEVLTELVRNGRVIDRISYVFSVVSDEPAPPDQIVRAEGGQFVLEGRPWYPHGVNFWPSCATGLRWFDYNTHWLDPSQYDPEVAERDLDVCASLGMNALSIQLMRRGHARATADFVERAGRRGIKCNIYLDGGHPLRSDLDRLTDLIELGHFAGNPNVWAYDVAWEPHVGDYQARRGLDPEWKQWIIDQYGSIDDAEADWQVAAPRDEAGEVTGPSQDQILNDGDWRVMVAAYRRFVDDRVSHGYNRVRRAIRAIDPDHLIGARTGWGGTGSEWADRGMPFDLRSGAKHLDFVSPEGYGIATDWDEARIYGFTTIYGRWAGNGKPVFWSEFGASLYPEYDANRIETQRKIYENMYRVILESGANGSAGWWYPGGRRLGEESDYGVVNPDGTPRASALELRKRAPRITRRGTLPRLDRWITTDRDLHPRGYSQVMKRHMARYVAILDAGHFPGVRTEATGTTSADVPAVAVGNRPWTGKNPHKYLNAEFNYVRMRGADGRWVDLRNGDTLIADPYGLPPLEVSVANTGEAAWLMDDGEEPGGRVWLEAHLAHALTWLIDGAGRVDRFGDFEIKVLSFDYDGHEPTAVPDSITLRMATKGGGFGEVFRVKLQPPAAK